MKTIKAKVSQGVRTLKQMLCFHGPLESVRRLGFKPSIVFVCRSCRRTFWPEVS